MQCFVSPLLIGLSSVGSLMGHKINCSPTPWQILVAQVGVSLVVGGGEKCRCNCSGIRKSPADKDSSWFHAHWEKAWVPSICAHEDDLNTAVIFYACIIFVHIHIIRTVKLQLCMLHSVCL